MYQEFAGVYDAMMSEIPYDLWYERIHAYLVEQGKPDGHLCELGCGTGQMTGRFCDAGYEVTGIDLSPDMLALAMERKKEHQNILYLNQDMTDFSLHKPADVVLCICDSFNYLLEEEELLAMFRCVREAMTEDGIFLFDMKTRYCYTDILGDGIRVEDEEDYTVIWDNAFDTETDTNEYLLTMFVRQEDDRYERYDECHVQRAYDDEVVVRLLKEAGLEVCHRFGADLAQAPGKQEERCYFVAKK